MPDTNPPENWMFMLGEMRGDLKFLVEERRATTRRLDDVETSMAAKLAEQDKRLGTLEAFKIRVGVLTGALGIFVPTSITIIARKLGLL